MKGSKVGVFLAIGIAVYIAVTALVIRWALERGMEGIAIGGIVFVITILVGSIVLIALPVRPSKLPPDK